MEFNIGIEFHYAEGGFMASEIDDKGHRVFLGKEKVYVTDGNSFKEAMASAISEFANKIIPEEYILQNDKDGHDETLMWAEIKLISR